MTRNHTPPWTAAFLPLLSVAPAIAQGISFPITTGQDGGSGSLRWAIEQANRAAGQASPSNRILLTFAPSLAGSTVTLTAFMPYLLASHVTISVGGTNPAPVTIDTGNGTGCVLVASGFDLLFQDLVFRKPIGTSHGGDNIILSGAAGTRFLRCGFQNPTDAGAFVVGSPATVFQECTFLGIGRGPGILAQDGSDHLLVERCAFSNFNSGSAAVVTVGLADIVIRDTNFSNNSTSFLLGEVCRSVVFGPRNRVTGGTNLAVNASTVAPTNFADPRDFGLRITEATMTGGSTTAILLQDRCTRVIIEKSVIDGNAQGVGSAQVMSMDGNGLTFLENTIANGGGMGIALFRTTDVVIGPGNHVYRNRGTGVFVDGTGLGAPAQLWVQSSAVSNCNHPSNAAGFMLQHADAVLANVTSAGNDWGVFALGASRVRIVNSILWGNRLFDRVANAGAAASMSYSMYASGGTGSYGSWTGSNNRTGSGANFPLFRNLGGDDIRLQGGSPALDVGDHTDTALAAADLDGEQRVLGPRVDLGADEFTSSALTPLRVNGAPVRSGSDGMVTLSLAGTAAHANTDFVLLAGLSGAGALPVAGVGTLPLQADVFTAAWVGNPALALGRLDGQATASKTIPIPAVVVPFLPRSDLTFAFAALSGPAFVSNPVIVDFLPWRE